MAGVIVRRRAAAGLQRACNEPSIVRWFSAGSQREKDDKFDADGAQKIDFGMSIQFHWILASICFFK